MRKFLATLLALVMTLALMVPASWGENKETYQLPDSLAGKTVILHTNDVHGAIDKYAKVAALRDECYDKGAHQVILLDAGDYSQGSPYVSLSKGATALDMMALVGYDVITLGNHTWGKMQITDYLEDNRYILRPANFSPRTPGRGYGVYDLGRVQVAVMVLIGRCDLAWGSDNPFTTADRLLKAGEKPTFTLVDFHAQATSEKLAMAYYLDGRVSALWGTHTHVPTADERVFPQGTGYITDLGMTGAVESVLGIRPEQSVETFLGGLPGRYRPAEGPCKAQGALFTLDSATGLCTAVERVDIR